VIDQKVKGKKNQRDRGRKITPERKKGGEMEPLRI